MGDLISREAVLSLPRDTEKTLSGMIINQYVNVRDIEELPPVQPEITLESAIDYLHSIGWMQEHDRILTESAQPEIIRCKDCKHWNQATAYHGGALSFGFCESDDMWRSLYGETTEIAHIDTDDDFFCGYAERREE